MKPVWVVGAGPAGASTALALLSQGVEVTVLERRLGVGPRVCGAFLDAEAIRHLDSLGLKETAQNKGIPVTSTTISVGSGKERLLNFKEPGLALSRPVLEQILLDAVRERGGKVRFGVVAKREVFPVVGIRGPGLTPEDSPTLSADQVIWADGRFSGEDPARLMKKENVWYGWNASFSRIAQKPGEMSLFFLPYGYVGILTFKDGTSNLCGLKRREDAPLDWGAVFHETRAQSPCFRRRTEGATLLSPWRSVGPLPFTGGLRSPEGEFRVGDAVAVGDPFMGEGIGRALGSGPLLVQAWALHPSWDEAFFVAFRRLWRSAYGRRFKLGNMFRWILNRPRFSNLALKAVLARPCLIKFFLPFFHNTGKVGELGVEC